MNRPPSLLLLALAGLGLSACNALDPDPTLTRFSSCEAMGDYMADMARQEILYQYRWDLNVRSVGMAEMSMDVAAEGADTPSSFSTTNLQEQDVDEADLVKTDGQYLYSLAGGQLVISLAWPHDEAAVLATLALDGQSEGIYLLEEHVVAVGRAYGRSMAPRSGQDPDLGPMEEWDSATVVTIVDISDPSDPQVVRETYAAGTLETSRRIGDQLYLVTHSDIHVGEDAETPRDAKKAVRKADPSQWLARRSDHLLRDEGWEVDDDAICDCEDVWASEREGGTYLTNVLSLDLSAPMGRFRGESVAGAVDTVYASPGSIYVAATEYTDGPFPTIDDRLDTIIHKFDIGDGDERPEYRASAKISGVLSDQFALSEQDGVLRVATTEWVDLPSSEVHTLVEEDGEFDHLDVLRGLAPGEEIYAARFVGDMGYLVTYEVQLGDPLITVDLSNPSRIRKGGELHVTGWSDYIHPMGSGRLLAVGMDETSSGDWRLAVSLFDVRDPQSPTLQDRELLDAWSSEAQDDHHAFNYFSDQHALAIPSWSTEGSPVLEVLEARVGGLDYTGQVPQEALLEGLDEYDVYCAPVRRSVIMDEYAYAISSAGFTVATLDAPEEVLEAVPFTSVDPCEGYYDSWGW